MTKIKVTKKNFFLKNWIKVQNQACLEKIKDSYKKSRLIRKA